MILSIKLSGFSSSRLAFSSNVLVLVTLLVTKPLLQLDRLQSRHGKKTNHRIPTLWKKNRPS